MNENVILDSSIHDIHNLNIISSTKINQKVTQILRIFDVLPPVSSAQKQNTEDVPALSGDAHDANAAGKTRTVVVIRAKANVASKLISIVEILKRDLAKRATGSHARENTTDDNETAQQKAARPRKTPIPRLYQYTSVITIPTEVKTKPAPPKPTQPSSTAPVAPDDVQRQGTKRKRPIDSSQDSTATALTTARTSKKQKQEYSIEDKAETPAIEEEEAFEAMANAAGKDAATDAAVIDAPVSMQMRNVPLLTVYLCSAPVAVLENALGEQGG